MSGKTLYEMKCGIADFLESVVPTQVPVFEMRPNVDRPMPPYVTYSLTSPSISLGQASITYSGSGTDFTIVNQKMMNVTIMTVGTDEDDDIYADQLAFDIEQGLATKAGRDILCENAGLAVYNTPAISNVSVAIETGFEERYALEVFFGYCTIVTDDSLGCIEKVQDLTGCIDKVSDPDDILGEDNTVKTIETIVKP